MGFETPSPIQEKAIPQLLGDDRDFIGLAQTGTGKTAAFGLPLLDRIDPSVRDTQALILAPTRELGQQIAQHLHVFSKYKPGINMLAVYGGAAISQQIRALKKPVHVIIATPGRLIDLIGRKSVKLDQLRYLILDEADEMLNMGFKEDIDRILSHTHEDKLTWLFSATMSADIQRIVKQYMKAPYEVRLTTKNEVNTNIDHQFAMVRRENKVEALSRFVDMEPDMRSVIFCRTRRDTQEVADKLSRRGYQAEAIHGDLSQAQRDQVMRRFKSKRLQLLIATDVAARGIDVDDLTHVFHLALPDDLPYYTHRSGRTARAGKKGTSIAFINGRERYKIDQLQKKLGISFSKARIPTAEDIVDIRIENWTQEVLETPSKKNIDSQLVERMNIMFGNLTKEELAAKLLAIELDKISVDSFEDLNEKEQKRGKNGHHKGGHHHGGGHGKKKHHGRPYSDHGGKPKKKRYKKRKSALK